MLRMAIIVAVSENGVIGRDNDLPWHLPEDLRHFRRVTMGKPVLMGRKTYESIGKPLPGRTNIVITRNPAFEAEGVRRVESLDEGLALAEQIARQEGVEEAVVIGGAQIYALALPAADRLYITRVHANIEGDTMLPSIDWSQWRETSREPHQGSGKTPYDYSFVTFDRC